MKEIFDLYSRAGWEIRLVGGAVRDMALGLTPHDRDFATPASPEEQMDFLTREGISYIPTGLHHGTITIKVNGDYYEVTTLRRDVGGDGRWANVEWTSDWEEDMARRDFTFNAMMMDRNGVIHDPFGGMEDLRAGLVRFVGNPHQRIEEDYLRILRFYRFTGRFSQEYCPGHLEAIQAGLGGFTLLRENGRHLISRERITTEMGKIFSGPNRHSVIDEMGRSGVLKAIQWRWDDRPASVLDKPTAHLATILSLYVDDRAQMATLQSRWALSREDLRLMSFLIEHRDFTVEYLEDLLSDGTPPEYINQLQLLRDTTLSPITPPPFPLSGNDLPLMGPPLGKALKKLRTLWKASRFTLEKDSLIQMVK